MSTLGTHVLDTTAGIAAAGMELRLFAGEMLLFEGTTDADGRCLALRRELSPGRYRLEFEVAAYFRARGAALSDPPFLDRVSIAFGVAEEDGHYHVPLLVSPFAYSTYRGS
jgi:5-hydroxyisourate hydrolase